MLTLASTMGRAAERGPGWTPSSIIARKIARSANEGSTMVAPAWQPVAHRAGSQPLSPKGLGTSRLPSPASTAPTSPGGFHFFRDPAANSPTASRGGLQEHLRREISIASSADGEEPRAMVSCFKPLPIATDPKECPKTAWASMLPRKDLGVRQASAPLLSASTSVTSSPQSRSSPKSIAWSDRPNSAPDGLSAEKTQGNSSTNHWRATEMSLGRDSLNCIVTGRHLDAPKSLQRSISMGRTAMRAAARGQ